MRHRTKSTRIPDLAPDRAAAKTASAAPQMPPVRSPAYGDVPQFIFSDEFRSLTLDEVCELPASTPLYLDRQSEEFADLSICGVDSIATMPVLSPAGERFLFRKMNFLKYLASEQLAAAGRKRGRNPNAEHSAAELLADADAARRHLAECNLRLVASIARRFATGQADFDELLSEGNIILLKAVDRFDYSRGFRFSTYLTYSVQRHFFRVTSARSRRRSARMFSPSEVLDTAAAPVTEEVESLADLHRIEELVRRMDECLTQREQWVVRERFGLGSENAGRPFREIAEEAGLSKERVRQIQLTALRKLKDFLEGLEGERAAAALA